jgi:hypothetical protein
MDAQAETWVRRLRQGAEEFDGPVGRLAEGYRWRLRRLAQHFQKLRLSQPGLLKSLLENGGHNEGVLGLPLAQPLLAQRNMAG